MTPPRADRAPAILRTLPWLGLAALSLALATSLWLQRAPPPESLTLTAGYPNTTRARLAGMLTAEMRARGLEVEVLPGENTLAELARIDSGEMDFALVSGAVTSRGHPHIREAAVLYPEALHLLVKREHRRRLDSSLAGLGGLRIDYGPRGSATAGLAKAVLEFAGVRCTPEPQPGECHGIHVELPEVDRLVSAGDRAALPDVVFHLATLPSLHAARLIQHAEFDLVEIPFAPAFRLGSLMEETGELQDRGGISRRFTERIEIPPFSYGADPPVPARAISTIGARLLLVTHTSTPPQVVERTLEAVFDSRFAHIPDPLLERSLLEMQPRYPLHQGTRDYLRRHRPWISGADVDRLSSGLSVLGALAGAGVFIWQAWQRRRAARRTALLADYRLRGAALERRLVELELAADLELDALASLQRDLLELKGEVLREYTAGTLGHDAALSELLGPLNAARDSITTLLLHVRGQIGAQAEREGRSSEELWVEAVEDAGGAQTAAP